MGTNAFKVKNHINIQPGAAPASPVYGDIYCDVSGVFRRWNGTVWEVLGAGGGSGTSVDVSQTGHGFVAADIGKAIRSSGVSGEYTFAMADTDDNAEVVGIISDAASGVPDQFSYVAIGPMTGLSGLTTGEVYFLSASASGVATTTEPSVVGQISKPLYIATSPTTAVVVNMRGATVGGTNLYSTISLSNNATTSFHTIQGEIGSGGLLTGSIKIDATTDYAIPFICMFSRPASGTYNVATQFGSDIPSGMSITNSGSSIQVVMPNNAGFVSASVTYAVQAAANGTTLPVSISASSVLGSTTGVAPAAGVIGESALTGTTLRSGTGGTAYTVRSTTVPNVSGSVETLMIGITLNKGVYLVSGHANGYSNTGVNFVTNFRIGATAITANRLVTLAAGAAADSFFSIPVTITSDNTVVAIYGSVSFGTAGTWGNEITAVRIG
jgi:hypothetical protein